MSTASSDFLSMECQVPLAASSDSLQVGCRDLALDTRTPSFSIEQHFMLQPILYAIITLSVHFPCSLLFLPQPPAFRHSYTFARHSIPGSMIVACLSSQKSNLCAMSQTHLFTQCSMFPSLLGQPSSDTQRGHHLPKALPEP